MNRALAAIALVACGPVARPTPTPDPAVDMACVKRAFDGKLSADLPAELGPYRVTATKTGAHLHRDGRVLDDAAGKQLWDVFNRDVFGAGVSMASDSMYSVKTCADADRRSCLDVHVWVCQLSLASLAAKLAGALDRAGLGDAQLSVDVTFVEARGPACRAGADCVPMQHYSTHGEFDPAEWRDAITPGSGRCANDGDCDGGGQNCTAWYLKGEMDLAYYLQYSWPTFCGCIDHRCAWFQQ